MMVIFCDTNYIRECRQEDHGLRPALGKNVRYYLKNNKSKKV
jgi:hypothetical protein